jgi:hypothetical protein
MGYDTTVVDFPDCPLLIAMAYKKAGMTEQKFTDECLNGEIIYSLREAQVIIEKWCIHYNTRRPHSALGYRPPAPATIPLNPTPLDETSYMQ